jgi:hypothetical protein
MAKVLGDDGLCRSVNYSVGSCARTCGGRVTTGTSIINGFGRVGLMSQSGWDHGSKVMGKQVVVIVIQSTNL